MSDSTAQPRTPSGSTWGLSATWIVLLALSVLTYYFAEEALSGGTLIVMVFVAVFIKLSLVIGNFMELRHHGRAWLLPALGFVALVLLVLTAVCSWGP